MNDFFQTKNFFIGSTSALKILAQKKRSIILVISDSHGHSEITRAILENYGNVSDALVFCGDGIFDFLSVLQIIKAHEKLLKNIPPVIATVQGNCDIDLYPTDFIQQERKITSKTITTSNTTAGKKDYNLIIPKNQILRASGMNIYISHGNVEGVSYGLNAISKKAQKARADLVLFGHTHIARREEIDCTTFINPGSIASPRQGTPSSFALVTIPGGQERIECTFFRIEETRTNGINFLPFVPTVI